LNPNDTIWTVSALNFEIKTMLEQGIGSIWIEGEISNFASPASGHWYFSLKDERAQLRAAMFKNRNTRINFAPENGQQVLVRAQVTLYEARGDFQVIVEHMEPAGIGRLMHEYEELKKKLAAEGLFEASAKQKIPERARHIGIITSTTGAAIRDALSVIRRRSPSSQVTIYPTAVQGEQATQQVVKAIQAANRHAQCEVLLLIRGGGSLEDLWCFNEEAVARAIHDSVIPIVSGIGHEIDFTIADFVADHRAPTPSVAAESVTMDQYELMMQFDRLNSRLNVLMSQKLHVHDEMLKRTQLRLFRFHPQKMMQGLRQRLEFAIGGLRHVENSRLEQARHKSHLLFEQLKSTNLAVKLPQDSRHIQNLAHLLVLSVRKQLQQSNHRLQLQTAKLDSVSPLKTLSRGYAAIVKQDQIVSSVTQLAPGDDIDIRLQDGESRARIID
jgi:exodeoxyribonuclease VII large subunit